jgi:adenylosuccinate lyase
MIDEMHAAATTIDYTIAIEKEKEIRHDVMAHVYEFGTHCLTAK